MYARRPTNDKEGRPEPASHKSEMHKAPQMRRIVAPLCSPGAKKGKYPVLIFKLVGRNLIIAPCKTLTRGYRCIIVFDWIFIVFKTAQVF